MNIRAVQPPTLLGNAGLMFLAPLLSPKQGSVTVVERNAALSMSIVGALVVGVVAIAVLKKKKVI